MARKRRQSKGPDGDEITLEEKTPKKMDVTDADKKQTRRLINK